MDVLAFGESTVAETAMNAASQEATASSASKLCKGTRTRRPRAPRGFSWQI